jgi:hypothetical protein
MQNETSHDCSACGGTGCEGACRARGFDYEIPCRSGFEPSEYRRHRGHTCCPVCLGSGRTASESSLFRRIAADEGTKGVPMGAVSAPDHPFTLWSTVDMSGRITVHASACRLCGRGKESHAS